MGDVAGNAKAIVAAAERACSELNTDLLVLPELTLSGYPPEDLLFHRGFRVAIEKGMATLKSARGNCGFLVGFPEYAGTQIFNSAALIEGGQIRATHRKSSLPNYKVFDEKRYFKSGGQPTVVDYRGFRIGVLVCEDIWEPEPAQMAKSAGAEMFVVLNASPYEIHKQRNREDIVGRCVKELGLPVVYVNMLGGQDELVFDGNSFVMDGGGKIVMRAPPFEEGLYPDRVRTSRWRREARARTGGARTRRCRERVSRARAWACATTWANTVFPAWSWVCRAASTRRSRSPSPSMRSARTTCTPS